MGKGKRMVNSGKISLRKIVFYIFAFNFLIAISVLLSIPSEVWVFIQPWQQIWLFWSFLSSFCSVLIAYWIKEDEKTIKGLERRIQNLSERLAETLT